MGRKNMDFVLQWFQKYQNKNTPKKLVLTYFTLFAQKGYLSFSFILSTEKPTF